MSDHESEERADQLGRVVTFRVPLWLYRNMEEAAGRELLPVSAWVRRGCVQSLSLCLPEGL